MRWDSDLVPGTDIGLESNLGMKDNDSSFNGAIEWRFLKRHALSVSHYKSSLQGTTDAPFDIVIGGDDYPDR